MSSMESMEYEAVGGLLGRNRGATNRKQGLKDKALRLCTEWPHQSCSLLAIGAIHVLINTCICSDSDNDTVSLLLPMVHSFSLLQARIDTNTTKHEMHPH